MKDSLYKILALWQRKYIPAIITILTTVAAINQDEVIGIIIIVLSGANTALGQFLENDSKDFFSDKDIIQIAEPITDAEKTQEVVG